MNRPLRTLELGTELFFRTLPLAIGLAVVCAVLQIALFPVVVATGGLPVFLFSHVWFILLLTGWHLRKANPTWSFAGAAGRAALFATPIAAVLTLIPVSLFLARQALQKGYTLDDPTAGDISYLGGAIFYSQQAADFVALGRQLGSAVWMLVWAAAILLGLPARIMGGRFAAPRPSTAAFTASLIAVAPWFVFISFLGAPPQTCTGECWGLFEGGAIMAPIFGAYLFTLSASCAALSAAARLAQVETITL